MPALLRLDCSASGAASRSRELTGAFTDAWTALGPDRRVVTRDLHADPLPHLEDAALHWPEVDPAGVPEGALQRRQQVVAELLEADVVVIGLPLYNYSLPSTLKAWLDRVHVPGVLAPTPGAPARPLQGRPVVVATSRGGSYDPGTPTEHWDHATPVLQIVLGEALGMDVHVVSASLTLADRLPELAEQRGRARSEMDAARTELVRLARDLPTGAGGPPSPDLT